MDRDDPRGPGRLAQEWLRWSTATRGRIPPGWVDLVARDPMLRTAQVVVDVVLGGQRAVASRGGGSWTSARDGRVVVARPSLVAEPQLEDRLTVGEPGPVGHAVSVVLDGVQLDVAAALARGPLVGVAEVSLLADGIDWDDRLVHVRGPLGEVRFGGPGEPVSLTVSDPAIGSVQVPPWVLDAERWPLIDESGPDYGTRCPLILGGSRLAYCPRVRWSGLDPAVHDVFLVGEGVLDVTEVVADGATVATADYEALQVADDLGLQVTVVRFLDASIASSIDVQVYATASRSDAGLVSLTASVARLLDYAGAGHLVHHRMLGESSARLGDAGVGSSGTSALRGDPVVVLHDAVSAAEYLAGTLLDEHPYASLAWDGGLVGVVVVDHRARPVARLEAGVHPVIGRVEGGAYATTPPADLRTAFRLRYQWSPVDDQYEAGGRRDPRNNATCAAAAAALGVEQPDGERQAVTIYEAAGAAFVLDWLVEHRARGRLLVDVDVHPGAWLALRTGDPVRWTDADVGLSDVPAIVVRRAWRGGSSACQLGLEIWPGE